MRYIVHADDLGLTKGITDNILDAVDNGAVTSVSIMANGHAFDYAIEELRARPDLRLAVHLNLCEGKPVLPPEEVGTLVDANGNFCHSFLSLWLKHIFSNKETKTRLAREIREEFLAQIDQVRMSMAGDFKARVDSHRHYHIIPFVFKILVGLSGEAGIEYIRLTREPFVWNLRAFFSTNLIKHLLLNSLSKIHTATLKEMKIDFSDFFVGLLFAGHISKPTVKSYITNVFATDKSDKTVEILLHPGFALESERELWQGRAELIDYYYSPWRSAELETAKDPELTVLLKGEDI